MNSVSCTAESRSNSLSSKYFGLFGTQLRQKIIRTVLWINSAPVKRGRGFTVRTRAQVPDIKTMYGIRRRKVSAHWVCQDPGNTKGDFVMYRGAKRERSSTAFGATFDVNFGLGESAATQIKSIQYSTDGTTYKTFGTPANVYTISGKTVTIKPSFGGFDVNNEGHLKVVFDKGDAALVTLEKQP